ncbi:MAG: glutaminase A [Pirellula sp.]|nr:glutaminase A [Pirellula sp.]
MKPSSDASLDALIGKMRSAASPLRERLMDIHSRIKSNADGKLACYIPELSRVDPNLFGVSIVSVDGRSIDVGDADAPFTIQSVSKPFVFGLGLEDHGRDYVLSKIGVQPVGEAFNTVVLDEVSNRPYNPMINAGAIASADLIQGSNYAERVSRMLDMFRRYFGHPVHIDSSVYASERTTGHRNRAIAHLMLNFGMIEPRIEETLDLYFQQCSILATSHDLAVMGATLANRGVNPITGERAIDACYVKDLLSVMYNCGMYDFAGEWGYRIGIPAKSGVGGGIVAVVPGKIGIGTFSPKLDPKGNSVRGIQFFNELIKHYSLNVFDRDEDQCLILEHFSK